MNNMIYWIWLSLCCSPATATFGKLIKEFDGAKAIYDAEDKRIASIIGYRNSDRKHLEDKNLDKATEIYEFCNKHKVGILCYGDEKYPDSLRSIDTPPVLLYYRGVLPDFNKIFAVAVVGTRHLSDYGRKSAFNISYDLATAGATVVSGMAIGIDGVSTAGSLAAGGRAVAIIGSGIDVCYPPQHVKLAREIVKNGCVMTEYAPGTPPNGYNFPKRNRIISGLSSAVLVIEGPERSGALITARYAKEQGKTVYALPGNVGSKNSQLSNLLLKNGAKICTSAEDILGDFSKEYSGVINPFLLKERVIGDLMSTLTQYGVSAVCPNDDIFDVPKNRWTEKKDKPSTPVSKADIGIEAETKAPPPNFDVGAIEIYKKIPVSGKCSIESLVDSQIGMREVMKFLLKLEMGGFISLHPGEMVSRKTN